VIIDPTAAPRVEFGAKQLVAALKAVKIEARIVRSENVSGRKIHLDTPMIRQLDAKVSASI